MNRRNASSSFWIKCVGYTQSFESFFTIGQKYEVIGGHVTSDRGHTYTDPKMRPNSNPAEWFLSNWYRFEIVDDVIIPEHLELSFEDAMGYTS